MFYIALPFTDVLLTTDVGVGTLTMPVAVSPFTDVLFSIGVCIGALAMQNTIN